MLDVTVKSTPEGRVGGYLVVWGSPSQRDLQGEFFTPQTDLRLDWYERRPVLYHHGLDGKLQVEEIGTIVSLKADDIGIWAEAQLDLRKKYARAVLRLVEKGILGWSSGSVPHLTEVLDDGFIKRWPIVEGSLTPTPAEPRRTDVHVLKSAYLSLGLDTSFWEPPADQPRVLAVKSAYGALGKPFTPIEIPDDVFEDETPPAKEPSAEEQRGASRADTLNRLKSILEGNPMNREILLALINAVLERSGGSLSDEEKNALIGQIESAAPADAVAKAEDTTNPEAMKAAMAIIAPIAAEAVSKLQQTKRAALETQQAAAKAAVNGLFASETPASQAGGGVSNGRKHDVRNVMDRRYDHASASDMALGAVLMEASGRKASDNYHFAMACKTADLVEKKDRAATDPAVKFDFPFDRMSDVMKVSPSVFAMKANEVMQTGLAGFGAEYVHTLVGTDVWFQVRQDIRLYEVMKQLGMREKEVPKGWDGETVHIEGQDVIWYVADGVTDIAAGASFPTATYSASKSGTQKKDVRVGRLSARTYLQNELDEDSVIDLAQELNRKIRQSGSEEIENVMANGDTATGANTNINLIDSTPAAAPNKPSYLLTNGIFKLPLVTNTANRFDAQNTLSEVVFLSLRAMLGTNGKYAIDPKKVLYLLDNFTYYAMMNMPSIKTRDVFSYATIENGEITQIFKSPVIASAQVQKARSSDGKISNTGGNNTHGRVGLVRPDQWVMVWKRQIDVLPIIDNINYARGFAAHMRWGLGYFDDEAAACAINVPTSIAA